MEHSIICTTCPKGCRIRVSVSDDTGSILAVEGNSCPRGKVYAENEVTDPRRVLTTSIRCGEHMVSVRTSKAVKKSNLFSYMEQIKSVSVTLPVHIGDVLLPNFDGEGTDLIATRNVEQEIEVLHG